VSLTPEQFPFTVPYGLAAGPLKSKGPTAEALKRFFGRIGKLEWTDYDQHYNRNLWELVADLKINQGIRKKTDPRDGSYGKEVWEHIRTRRVPTGPHKGEYALDFYSRKIVQDEAGLIAVGTALAKVQFWINDFWRKTIANADRWHYDQHRLFDPTVDPEAGGESDCSAMVVQSSRYAQTKSGIIVPDPSKYNYSGAGNTDDHEDDWPKIGSPFRVGDLAHFHSERHVIQCIKPGTFDTAEWGSNGSERAPELIESLRGYSRFPGEYMFTVRPPLTNEELKLL
jgi:hypothetical protein